MFKKILRIFRKDAIVASRDGMLIIIILMPLLLAVGILFFAPGVTDSSIKLALLDSDTSEHIEYMEKYTQVELFSSVSEIERRVNKNDDIAGLVAIDDGYEIILEGNESDMVREYTILLNSYYSLGVTEEDTTAEILSFENIVPPLKSKLANMLILMIAMLSGMIISLGIVEEKKDNTINAINVTPVSQNGFIVGKCLLGGIASVISIIVSLLILGYYDINWIMILIAGVTSMLLSFIIGFLQGLASGDVMEAATGVKMLMLPTAGSIIGYELLSPNWQWTMYWSPFYWAYKANDMILSKTAEWGIVLLCVAVVFALSFVVYIISIPKIREGLS